MAAPRRNPPPLPGLDLSSLDLEPTARILRQWALGTLERLFDERERAPSERGGDAVLDDLGHLELHTWRWRRKEPARLEAWVRRHLRLADDSTRLSQPISFLITRDLRQRQRRFRWPGRRRPRPPAGLPDALWPIIATLAWQEPRFTRRVGGLIHSHFRRERLVFGDDLPAPVLRPQVFWLVLALAGVPDLLRPRATRGFRVLKKVLGERLATFVWRRFQQRSRRGRLARRLSALARVQWLAAEGWAGFWEQWLVGELLLAHRQRITADEETRQVLGILPLLTRRRFKEARNELAEPATEAVESVLVRIIDRRFKDQQPSWLDLG